MCGDLEYTPQNPVVSFEWNGRRYLTFCLLRFLFSLFFLIYFAAK
jgi:hypothetical protein